MREGERELARKRKRERERVRESEGEKEGDRDNLLCYITYNKMFSLALLLIGLLLKQIAIVYCITLQYVKTP